MNVRWDDEDDDDDDDDDDNDNFFVWYGWPLKGF